MHSRKMNLNYFLLCFVVAFVPLHYFVCEILLSGSKIDNLMRDIIVIFLFFSVTKLRFKRKDLLMIFSCIILVVFAIGSYLVFHYSGTFNVLKTYLVPMLFYFVCSNYNFSEGKYARLQKIIIVEMAIIGIIGFLQAFFLGDQFLISLGYPSLNGFLNASSYYIGGFLGYQRNIGTLVSPNACGAVLACALLIHLVDSHKYITAKRWIITFALIVALLGTFSRSAIFGAIIAFVFVHIVNKKAQGKLKLNKKFIWIIPIALLSCILVIVVDSKLLNGRFYRMLSSSFRGTITGTDVSMQGHIQDLLMPFETVLNNPFGLGFGSNGPMAISTFSGAHSVESSIYLMIYEVGIIPAIVIFIPYIKIIIDTLKNRHFKYYVPFAVTIMTLVTYFLLSNIQTYEVLFFVMMFMGFYYNRSIVKIYSNSLIERG